MIKLFGLLSLILFSCVNNNPEIEVVPIFVELEIESIASLDTISPLEYLWLDVNDVSDLNIIINRIKPPLGFTRSIDDNKSFAFWLKRLPLKDLGSQVYLFDGSLKGNQNVHHAIINIDIGSQDLQQCADAVMRLRAEYLYWNEDFNAIHFKYTSGDEISFEQWRSGQKPSVSNNKVRWNPCDDCNSSYGSFRNYMTSIYRYAGTASLSKELKPIDILDLQSGDVFIQGGFPGHAVIVLDVCQDAHGKKSFLLAQSYMPAQDIHILKNPSNDSLSPWYSLEEIENQIITPEWNFNKSDLKRFQ